MTETRGITWRKLKEMCDWKTSSHYYCYKLVDVCKKDKCTADLTTAEFETYLAQIKQLAAEYGCYVPDPNEYEVRE